MARPRIYAEPSGDLQQGDIIQHTEALEKVLKTVHRHFLDTKYTAFIVLTQTCDLVRRNGNPCRSPYINLAVVRPLEDVLFPYLNLVCGTVRICGKDAHGVYLSEAKGKAKGLLERIINQNEQAMGLFYLHENNDAKIARPSVALLQVSIALRAREHYDVLVKARSGSLERLFQAKLGWLIGTLFARVATPDWDPPEREAFVASVLNGEEGSVQAPRWVDRESVERATKAGIDIETLSSEQVAAEVARHRPPLPLDQAVAQVLSLVKEVLPAADSSTLDILRSRLKNDMRFQSVVKSK